MSKHIINAGATSQRFYIYLQDSTTGQGELSVTGATCFYVRDAVSGTMPAAVTLTFGASFATPGTYPAWSSGQVRELAYMPGMYLVDLPDAIFAAGVRNAVVQIFPTSGTPWLPVNLEFTLSAINVYDSVRMGMTALPNTSVTTNGSLITSGTGTDQLSVTGGRATANTTQWGGTAVTGMPMPTYTQPTGFLAATFPTTVASPTNITAGTITTVSGNVNGNVTGSVGSVTGSVAGSVGSVAGNVGGNVVGSVNSVATAVTVGTINNNVITAASISTGAVAGDVWNALVASHTVAESFGARIIRTLLGTTVNQVTINAQHHIAANVHQMQANVIDAASIATGAIDADALNTDAVSEIADGILARDLGSGTNAGVLNERTVRSALRAIRNRTSITGTALTVTNETDNLTTGVAWTATLATNPLADPVTGIDPA